MNTQLTEDQLVHIKKSLENSLELVKRGLRHYSNNTPHNDVTPQIKEAMEDPNSYYYLHPEWTFHFQNFEQWIEVRFHFGYYYVAVSHFIPKHDTEFSESIYIFGSYYNSLDAAKLCPAKSLERIYKNCNYGHFDKLDDAVKLFHKFIYQVLCYDDVSLELPF